MRTSIQSNNGLKVLAVSGTNSIILGFDMPQAAAQNLMGFTIYRNNTNKKGFTPNDFVPLEGLKYFENLRPQNHEIGDKVSSKDFPFQDFFWSDFTVKAGVVYTYRIEARGGVAGALTTLDQVELSIQMENHNVNQTHDVYFNRSVAGSQGFSRFLEKEKLDPKKLPIDNPKVKRWLSGGLEEAMNAFISQANNKTYQLRCAFYEFEYEPVIKKLIAAKKKGVDLQIVIHGKNFDEVNTSFPDPVLDTKGKEKDKEVTIALSRVKKYGLENIVTWRTKTGNISHNKFMVLLQNNVPIAVWTGSTNLTVRGIFAQSNVGHIVRDKTVAASYLEYWTALQADTVKKTMVKETIDISNDPSLVDLPANGASAFFSPRPDTNKNKTPIILDWYAKLIDTAQRPVFLTLPFNLVPQFESILTQNPRSYLFHVIMEDGQAKKAIELNAVNPINQIAYGTYVRVQGDLEALLKPEIGQPFGSGFYVHTKYLLIDPLSSDPIVVSGSANFSNPSIFTNDENTLVIRGDLRVADIYLGEFMRLFRHFYYRNLIKEGKTTQKRERMFLNEKPADWVPAFYNINTPKALKRAYFSGS